MSSIKHLRSEVSTQRRAVRHRASGEWTREKEEESVHTHTRGGGVIVRRNLFPTEDFTYGPLNCGSASLFDLTSAFKDGIKDMTENTFKSTVKALKGATMADDRTLSVLSFHFF